MTGLATDAMENGVGDHLTAMLLKALATVMGLAWFGWHTATVLAQVVPPSPADIGNLVVTGGSTGAIVGVLYWAINRIDRIFREIVADREADERRREERWIAHDTKRDETLRVIAERTGVSIDRNTEALVRNDTNIRRCEERHAREERKATG